MIFNYEMVDSTGYNDISNDSTVNNCFIIYNIYFFLFFFFLDNFGIKS